MEFNAINDKECHLLLEVIGDFGGTDTFNLAFIVSMCLVQGFLAATGFIGHLDFTLTAVPPRSLSLFYFS